MRIIIESDERERVATSVHVPTEPGPIETRDGGAPSEMIIRAIAETLPMLTEMGTAREGIDAGPPPEWLVEAIQGATSPQVERASGDSDAGAAPSTEA
jgi:hypothetical protein